MFGEISLLAWMGSAIVFAIGGGAGFFIARKIKDKRTLELEQQLQATQSKLTDYQDEVNRHFLKSSLLFSKLTDNYRDVYEHLATGAQKLCNEKPVISSLDLPDTKILSAAVAPHTESTRESKPETDVAAAGPTAAESAAAEPSVAKPAVAKQHAEQQAEDEHLGVESITTHQAVPEDNTGTETAESAGDDKNATINTANASPTTEQATAEQTENPAENDAPAISAEELKALEANEQKEDDADDVHLGAESTPGVELEHHKTHPAIH